MEEVGRKMVERCVCLPLAINVLGGVLASKDSLDEWKEMHEHIDMHLRRGEGHHEQDIHGVQGILALSYHELPYRLKPCFLFLSHFQEDFEIPTKEFIRLWVAEGFVPQVKKESMEDVAEFYLHELINRCIIQVGEKGHSGSVKTCRVHDLMRDLCLLVANEDNFFEIVVHAEVEQVVSLGVQRRVVYVDDSVYRTDFARNSKLRSLVLLPKKDRDINCLPSDDVITMFKCYKLLRVLILKKCISDGKNLMKEIGYLVHLRYLFINAGGKIAFPSSIGNLRYLQTLVVHTPHAIVKLPNVIWKLERLRHLSLACPVESTSGKLLRLGNLKNLQTLQGFDTDVFDVNELANLPRLKKLSIACWKGFEELKVILQTQGFFNQLSSLQIEIPLNTAIEETDLKRLFSCCRHLYKLHLDGRIKKLPEHNLFPPNLTKLTLKNTYLEEDPMATLEKLPKLRFLCLCYGAKDGIEIVCSSKGFAQLKTLVIKEYDYRSKLKEWRVEEEAMPNLCELRIIECWELKMLPDGLRFITTLRKLEIIGMPERFKKGFK